MMSSPKARGTAPLSKYPREEDADLAAFRCGRSPAPASATRMARRWQAHHGAGVGAFHAATSAETNP